MTDSGGYRPSPETVRESNVVAFCEQYGIDDSKELIGVSTSTDSEGVTGDLSGTEWFWSVLPSYFGIEWETPYEALRESAAPPFDDWYCGGELNIASNTVDRYVADADSSEVAVLAEGERGDVRMMTYVDLQLEANRVANALEALGVGVGDTVGLFMPMVPEAVSVLYGCLKAGAVPVPVFSGYESRPLSARLQQSGCSVVFTVDGFYHGGTVVESKEVLESAAPDCVESCVVKSHLGRDISLFGHDLWWEDVVASRSGTFSTRSMSASAPALLYYTSGTTGAPKGVVHSHAGALLNPMKELHFGYDFQPTDRLLWTTDMGWVMSVWSIIGAHALGGTVSLYSGSPTFRDVDRLWRMAERQFLTHVGLSPSLVRRMIDAGSDPGLHYLDSLRYLGATGEPWDTESWKWLYRETDETPIITLSGGTEFCCSLVMSLPTLPASPGSVGYPALGMPVDVVDKGESVLSGPVSDSSDGTVQGNLVVRDSVPPMTRSLWGGDDRYLESYWSTFAEQMWDHGDWVRVDADGLWYVEGRTDELMNVSGRRVSPHEIKDVVVSLDSVRDACVVGEVNSRQEQHIVVYVIESDMSNMSVAESDVVSRVVSRFGRPFRPSSVRFVDAFPQTQSGKIIRDELV